MKNIPSILPRWFPALLVMLVIFAISSQPADQLPDFLNWDYVVKKAGHMIGYGLLAWSYLHFLRHDRTHSWLVWAACVSYAAADEFHQSFIPGRSATILDVLVFDNLGAILGLWSHSRYWRRHERNFNQT
jgi:VanZ family protein